MLVPEAEPKPVNGAGKSPTPYPDETTSTPGATTSGLSHFSCVGPRELKPAITSPWIGAASDCHVNVACAVGFAVT